MRIQSDLIISRHSRSATLLKHTTLGLPLHVWVQCNESVDCVLANFSFTHSSGGTLAQLSYPLFTQCGLGMGEMARRHWTRAAEAVTL